VLARPASLLLVPPDVTLAFGPRLAGRVGGCTVVQDAAVRRPRPRPLRRHPALLRAGLASGGLVDLVGEAAAVDPASTAGGAVRLKLGVGGERRAVGAGAVDLPQ